MKYKINTTVGGEIKRKAPIYKIADIIKILSLIILRLIAPVIIAILMIDAMGFFWWVGSGQFPADNFYVGSITAHILRFVIF